MFLDKEFYKQKRKVSKEGVAGFSLAFITVLGYCIFSLIPMILAVGMAFMDIKGYSFEGATFVGVDNFKDIVGDPTFWKSIGNTFYMALSLPINIILSLIVAYLLSKNIRGKKIYRTIYFIPYVCSIVAITLMWQWIFNYNYGILNSIRLSHGKEAIDWLGNPKIFIPSLLIMGVWSGTGYGIILYSAALTNVNNSLYEAARVDGANSFKTFFHITLPAISPTTFYLFITGLIGALQEFTRSQVLVGSSGTPETSITVVYYLWRRGFVYYEMGPASATAWLLAIIILLFTVINFVTSKLWVSYD